MKLYQSWRARLRILARGERAPPIDRATTERAAQTARLARTPPREVRVVLLRGLAMAGAAVLVLAVVSSLDTRGSELLARAKVPRTPAPVAQHAPVDPPRARPVGACASSPNLPFPPGDGERRLDLGTRALLVANRPAIVAARQTADCDLRVGLAEGGLAVHVRDLEGRSLLITTLRGDVRVEAAMLQVEFNSASGQLAVGVEEGSVELVTHDGQTVALSTGRAAYVGADVEIEPFKDSARAHLRRVLGLSRTRARSAELERSDSELARSREVDAPAHPSPTGSGETEEEPATAKPKRKRKSDSRRAAEQ